MAAKKPTVPDNQYDERRETLVVETKTTWPAEASNLTQSDRYHITSVLHGDPKNVKQLEYIRCPTGLVRHITVTDEDLQRVR